MLNHDRRSFLASVATAIASTQLGRLGSAKALVRHMTPGTVQLPVEGEMPSLGGATEWLNSHPLTADGLRGKVVLIDFCTYTCINWLRTLPYVRAWAEKYQRREFLDPGVEAFALRYG